MGHAACKENIMSRFVLAAASLAAAALFTTSASAQSDEKVTGPYAVARAGVAADSDIRLRDRDAEFGAFRRDSDFKPGFTGELGGGYDFGGFRLEGTVGYANAKLDRERQQIAGADGRARSLNLGLSGYVDIPLGQVIVPYLGAGIGASRVKASFLRPGVVPGADSRFSGNDWGFSYHVDAGVGVRVAPATTVEFGARYMRTTKLDYDGRTGLVAQSFRPRLSSVSAMVGVRQVF